MFKYETHCHTSPVSKCGRASAENTVCFYKQLGYDGIFITNHFLDGNINPEARALPYRDQIEYYFTQKNEANETAIEDALLENGFLYEKSEDVYIEDENVFVIYYNI